MHPLFSMELCQIILKRSYFLGFQNLLYYLFLRFKIVRISHRHLWHFLTYDPHIF